MAKLHQHSFKRGLKPFPLEPISSAPSVEIDPDHPWAGVRRLSSAVEHSHLRTLQCPIAHLKHSLALTYIFTYIFKQGFNLLENPLGYIEIFVIQEV